MKVMLAEYATCTGLGEAIRAEGAAMLKTLKACFERTGCRVLVPGDFGADLTRAAKASDCGIVIAPDDRLADDTARMEAACINLGSSPAAIRLCADKAQATELLLHNGLPAPRILREGPAPCVVKPRFGYGSEGAFVAEAPVEEEGLIATELIEGEHLSVTLIGGEGSFLPLALNRQHIRMDGRVEYDGNDVNIDHPARDEIVRTAIAAGEMAGCRGLFGVDIVYGHVHDGADVVYGRARDIAGAVFADQPYVVDINPRPTTSIVGVARAIDRNLADLVLLARFSRLPDHVGCRGRCSFTKKDLEAYVRR